MLEYVDDSRNGQTNSFLRNSKPPLTHFMANAQQDAQWWTAVLGASGGSLELSKCNCHVAQWLFTMDGAPVLAYRKDDPSLQIGVTNQHTGQRQHLQSLSPYEAHRTLGYYKEPAGKQKEQFRKLKE